MSITSTTPILPQHDGADDVPVGFRKMFAQVVTCPSNLPVQAQVVTTSGRAPILTSTIDPRQFVTPSC